ncbi:PH domain-containing protein [Gordonia hankookensis]|uniref:PH domain-containing protein n=1 Tax=Gordonia hankookensis TaxID=589403 RepID=A0ABR7WA04_9ACTN|nr:PH domain-containing protein [Gordonia hankookensis]MBD1318647.1 PH domain-containing protein [Gordonia hankookensis]NDZ94170.1 PH domain-containing protein [Streptomyces sp. SID11726]NEB25180.1 PH domain-containing protein [Streptomyces sp. SID6673]
MEPTPPLLLREPVHQVDPRAVTMWRMTPLLTGIPVLAAAVVVAALADQVRWAALAVAVVAVVLTAFFVVVVPGWRYRFHRWEISDDAVYTQSGWFVRSRVIIPIARIQVVDTAAGPIEQTLNLATLTVTTASSAGTIRIVGLDATVARNAAADLTARTQAHTDDAT